MFYVFTFLFFSLSLSLFSHCVQLHRTISAKLKNENENENENPPPPHSHIVQRLDANKAHHAVLLLCLLLLSSCLIPVKFISKGGGQFCWSLPSICHRSSSSPSSLSLSPVASRSHATHRLPVLLCSSSLLHCTPLLLCALSPPLLCLADHFYSWSIRAFSLASHPLSRIPVFCPVFSAACLKLPRYLLTPLSSFTALFTLNTTRVSRSFITNTVSWPYRHSPVPVLSFVRASVCHCHCFPVSSLCAFYTNPPGHYVLPAVSCSHLCSPDLTNPVYC